MNETYIFGNVGGGSAQIGTNTMVNTSGSGNSGFGNSVFTNLTTGVNNSGFGVEVASGLSFNGSNNTVFGVEVMKDATTASDTSAFGYQALTALTSGNNNTALGSGTGGANTTASTNIIMGTNADVADVSAANAIVIGPNAVGADGCISIGSSTKCLSTATASNNIVIGSLSTLGDGSANSIIVGYESGNMGAITDCIGIGTQIMMEPTSALCDKNLFVGWTAGEIISEATEVVGLGEFAAGNMNGTRVTAVGYESFAGALSRQLFMMNNTGVGYFTGNNVSGANNTFVGFSTGGRMDADSGNTGIGGDAMEQIRGAGTGSIVTTANTQINAQADFTSVLSTSDFNLRVFTVALYGNTIDIMPGTAATGVAGGLLGVFKIREGGVATRERFGLDTTNATAAFLGGTYFLISSTTTDYYVWYDVDNLSVDPMVAAHTAIQVDISAADSSATIASKTSTAIKNTGGSNVIFIEQSTTLGEYIKISNVAVGAVTDISDGTAVGSGKIAGVAVIRQGGVSAEISIVDFAGASPSGLAGTYFELSSPGTNYYVWFNSGSDTDPALPGKTGIQVSYTSADYNTGVGWRAIIGNVAGINTQVLVETTAIGYQAGLELNTNSNFNTIIGYNAVTANTAVTNYVAVGANTTSSLGTEPTRINTIDIRNTALGLGSGATPVANTYQIGANSVSGSATLGFRTQTVADESWIGGGSSSLVIDNSGNIVKGITFILTATTTDTTSTTMETYTMVDNTTRHVEALVMGTRTGGIAGGSANTYSVRLDASVKRTGGAVTINKVTEIHLQDPVTSLIIVNNMTGPVEDIGGGTAVGGLNELYSVGTLVDGSNTAAEVSLIDFKGTFYFGVYNGRYITLSSPTVNYYVWWDYFGIYADPGTTVSALAGYTGIPVVIVADSSYVLATKTAAAINAVGGGAVFTATKPATTFIEITDATTANVTDIQGGTAIGITGGLTGVLVTNQGGITAEKSLVDATGATFAGLTGGGAINDIGRYFLLWPSGVPYYVWFGDGGTLPILDPGASDPHLIGKTGLQVNINGLGTDALIASAIATAVNGLAGASAAITNNTPNVNDTTVRVANVVSGAATDIGPGNAVSPGFSINYVTTLVDGVTAAIAESSVVEAYGATPAGVKSTYFIISTPPPIAHYYVWYDTDGTGVDPALVGATGVSVGTLTGDSTLVIASKTATAINSIGGAPFAATVQSPWVLDIVVSGTDAILQVTGALGNDITWKAFTRNFAV